MRLKTIKLSGFKSFVDPTAVTLPGDLVAIVGPNGCGKSNIIDAVRWVMGESSAKHLRGESMADVIFNGSNSRKPVGTAAIELIFDNSDGSIGGQYASYAEISVRRQVNRDGQSAYYLNGTRCRKRDITDVFLGTGLGPRSYSIIEQGMISRVIEARPEDLRGYLEEAAGISLYKERRKETERRIRDTLENLERLEDVRDEVGRQLDKLQRQAETAERYRSLKEEERRYQSQLHVLRLQALDDEREARRRELAERETALESEVATQRRLEREAETVRARHAEDSDRLNEIQASYYSLGSEIARIDQQMSHRRELREGRRKELERNREAFREVDENLTQDREKLAVLRERLEELEPAVEEAREREAEAAERVAAGEGALEGWRERWERFNRDAAEPVRAAQVERTRIEQLERRGEELERRRERLAVEADGLRLGDAEAELEQLTEERAELDEAIAEQRERQESLAATVADHRERVEEATETLDALRGTLQRDEARLTSLRTLQEAALGDDAPVAEWLAANGLADAPRLVHELAVAPGWERAVETVLADALQAVFSETLPRPGGDGAAPERGTVMLFGRGPALAARPRAGLTPLAEHVRAPEGVADLLGTVFAADDAAAAERIAGGLEPGESVITPDGQWLGPRWLRLSAAPADDEGGMVAREREIATLETAIEATRERIEGEEATRTDRQGQLETAQAHRDEAGEALAGLERDRSALDARIEGRRQRIDEVRERRETLAAEQEELAEQAAANDEDIRAARGRLDEALDAAERHDGEREQLTAEKVTLQERLDQARAVEADCQSRRQDVALKLESAGSARGSLEAGIERLAAQRERLEARQAELESGLDELGESDDDLQTERERLLARRAEVEENLTAARARLGEADSRLRELETERTTAERRVGELREAMEGIRYRDQELRIRAQTQAEQLAELGVERQAVAAEMPEAASEAEWEQALEQVGARIKRLGPINLAAIDEYEALNERKGYLDSQHADLTEALETLQSAIRRIDRETRQRFKETFEKVNEGMQRLFPRLFGGGQAYLEMTGEDLLETGVAIMARPPGKKITNIHLLSGGEKALTAVALVFAIFELNPAPFCMLDEVDAPLDEANVGRFCAMVREMSERVQFIIITHNKTTMESATHLAGVTMNEPGVSRLVSVDVEAAAELAAL